MAQHPFLKSIRPVNLLSFGPNTEEIELRPLNILIGPNGSGKSNLIEVFDLLHRLPDKDPWIDIRENGGADEWIWKGKLRKGSIGEIHPSVQITFRAERPDDVRNFKLELTKHSPTYSFQVYSETISPHQDNHLVYLNRPFNAPETAYIYEGRSPNSKIENLDIKISVLAQLFGPSYQKALANLPQELSKIALYRDWAFGTRSLARDLQPAGLDSYQLAGDSGNLAQVLKALRDRGEPSIFDRLIELFRLFYAPTRDVDTEILGTRLRVMIKEEGLSSRTPAERLSDGTLRWLMLLIILLDPTPPSVICIDEPELGLHPDAIHILADLLRDASTRTQLIVTTHSDALVDAFSDDPEAVCVCEKVEGSTVVRRLDKDRLKVWLKDYSLGHLWMSGEIGGNRW